MQSQTKWEYNCVYQKQICQKIYENFLTPTRTTKLERGKLTAINIISMVFYIVQLLQSVQLVPWKGSVIAENRKELKSVQKTSLIEKKKKKYIFILFLLITIASQLKKQQAVVSISIFKNWQCPFTAADTTSFKFNQYGVFTTWNIRFRSILICRELHKFLA